MKSVQSTHFSSASSIRLTLCFGFTFTSAWPSASPLVIVRRFADFGVAAAAGNSSAEGGGVSTGGGCRFGLEAAVAGIGGDSMSMASASAAARAAADRRLGAAEAFGVTVPLGIEKGGGGANLAPLFFSASKARIRFKKYSCVSLKKN